MTTDFTSEDADRVLRLGDQFLEDWQAMIEEGSHPADDADLDERRAEWRAIRPLLVGAPTLFHALVKIERLLRDSPCVAAYETARDAIASVDSSPHKPDITKNAIAANINAMRQLLADTVIRVSEGFQAIQQGEQNQAIGTILDLDRKLEDVLALYRAAVALHRTGRAP